MSVILARTLLNADQTEIYGFLPPRFDLQFDDGAVINTTRRRTVFSRFMWRYHLEFPKIPLLKEHHLQSILEKGSFGSNTHVQLCSTISKEIYKHYPPDQSFPGKIAEIAYRQSVEVSNYENQNLAAHAGSIDLIEGIEIVRHPRIIAAKLLCKDDSSKIPEAYDAIKEVIMKDPSLNNNNLAQSCRNNTVKMGQVLKSIMCGKAAEPDGKLFDISTYTGYLEGNYDIFDFASESRSATKAIAGTEAPLQDSSYMARRFQLIMSVVKKISGYDCGNNAYEDWPVQEKEYDDENRLVYPGGIVYMKGKFYLNPETGKEEEITGKEEHLNGKILKLRMLKNCQNKDPHTVCCKCFGGMWRNYYPHQNLGHACSTTFTERVIQQTLGIKHNVASSHGEGIKYNSISSYFFRKTRKATNYVLNTMLKRMDLKITLRAREAIQLVDAVRVKNIHDLRMNKLTRIFEIRMDYNEKGNPMFAHVEINQKSIPAFVTMEFIRYIIENPWTATEDNDFQIDMKHWDFDKPVFAIPEMEKSDAEHGKEVGRLIESNMSSINDRQNPESALSTLQELFELATIKMDIQLSCLEVMLYALMIPSRNNHAMARGWSDPVLSVARNLIISRSLAPAYAFQGHAKFMLNPKAFFPHFRPDSDFDVFFAPAQMLKDVPMVQYDPNT